MELYNTRSRSLQKLSPLQDNTVRIYTCGPTVYNHAHIGNLSSYIFADTLHRAVRASGYPVQHIMNYTDVDDKTIRRSREQYPHDDPRQALHKLTNQYIDIFLDDMQKAGNDTNGIQFVRATDERTIAGMRELIARLHNKGFAYIADDGVYFSIEAYRKSGKTYGQLLELTTGNTSEARIQNDEYDKESVHDFALWKKQKEGEPAWEFTLDGQDLSGRPGWHIECSVMSRQALGQPFDIHTGGIDLIFPHHENEIAQSTALEDNPVMATFFTHNEHILVDGKKMSKSANNFYTLDDIAAKGYDPLAFRLLVLQAHYRSQVNFTWESLDAAANRLKKWQAFADLQFQALENAPPELLLENDATMFDQPQLFIRQQLQDDLNTPQAITWVDQLSSRTVIVPAGAKLKKFKQLLLFLDDVFGLQLNSRTDITTDQKELIKDREAARASEEWARSNELRDELAAQGISVRDTPYGPVWTKHHQAKTV